MSRSAFQFLRRGIALFGAAVFAASCAGTQPDDATAEPDRGKIIVLCGATEDWCAAHAAAFTEKTGTEASFVRLSSGEAVARLQAGKSSPEFSVWHGGPADGYVVAANAGLLEPYISPNAGTIRSEWKAPDGSWTGIYVGVQGFCSNTKRLAEKGLRPPTSWASCSIRAMRRTSASRTQAPRALDTWCCGLRWFSPVVTRTRVWPT